MTVIEVLIFLCNLLCGLFVGSWMAGRFGVAWSIPGIFLGFGCGIGFFKTITFFFNIWYTWRPLRPVCHYGTCKAKDYIWLKRTERGAIFRCNCGGEYLKSGNYFMKILPDGSLHPYMKFTIIRGWKPDDR